VKGGFLLNVVVAEGPAILKLLSCKDQTLLIRGDSFLILDLGLHVVNRVRWLNIKSDGLASESLNKDLHSSTKTKHQVKGGFLLNVVVAEGPAILKLLSCKDQTLLIRGDSFLILDLGLHVVNRVRWLNIKSDGLASESLDKNL